MSQNKSVISAISQTSDRFTEYGGGKINTVVNSPCYDGGQVELEKISQSVTG